MRTRRKEMQTIHLFNFINVLFLPFFLLYSSFTMECEIIYFIFHMGGGWGKNLWDIKIASIDNTNRCNEQFILTEKSNDFNRDIITNDDNSTAKNNH